MEKEYNKAVCCHPMKCRAGWITSWKQDGQEKYQQTQICRWYHSNGRKGRGTKSLFMRVKEESEKAGLKLNIKNIKIMAYIPITSWQIQEEKVETMTDFISLGSKIIVDGDCSHKIKRCLVLGRRAMTNLDSILTSRDTTLLTKVHTVKAMDFPVAMYGCETWILKKAECWRSDAFKLWC